MTEPLPAAMEPAALTEALRRSGALGDGRVSTVDVVSTRTTVLSRITRLRLGYDGRAPDAPATVILKADLPGGPGAAFHAGRQEVAFYTRVASTMPPGVVPRCFDAAWDAATGDWHLLLEDLSDSHLIVTAWPLPPSPHDSARIVTALAHFHAAWWDNERLGTAVGSWADPANPWLPQLAERVKKLADRLGEDLPPARRRLYDRLLAAAPRLLARNHGHRHLTVVHGDAHVWNCFLPRDPASADVRLFDWDGWRVDVATDDLAYMMALHWYPERRQRLERPLLDAYHAALTVQGVRGYDRAALEADYRLSVLWQSVTPVQFAAMGIPPAIWWPHLQRIWLAVDDLDCAALLD